MESIILYGAGQIGRDIAKKFRRLNIPVECFCDADPAKRGRVYSGLAVKSIEDIKNQYKKGDYKILLSLNMANRRFVKDDLLKKGIFEEVDFCGDSYEVYMLNAVMNREPENSGNAEYYINKAAENHIQLDGSQENLLKEAFLKHGIADAKALNTEYGKKEILYNRFEIYRARMIPWLNSIRMLKGARVLEIGCGTGAATIPLCEQGAEVCAVDINEHFLAAAKERAKIYGFSPQFIKLSAEDIKNELDCNFDFIIYTASLEHMTYTEKINTIKAAFSMLGENQYIILSDIPNRLWHTDYHTSYEPFYHWLPESLAIDYAEYTKREKFNSCFKEDIQENPVKLARWGRGVSYHEFEIAIGKGTWKVASRMSDFLGLPDDLFKWILKIHGPEHIDEGFYEADLNIALKKCESE